MLLLLLTVLTSCAEVISLSSVLPFIGMLTSPERVFAHPAMVPLIGALHITSSVELVLPLSIGFAVISFVAGGLRLLMLWFSIRFGNATGADLSIEVYRRTLYQPYSLHVARSSSEIISGITQKVGTATSVMISGITVITSTCLFVAIMVTLLAVDPVVAIIASMCFGASYLLIARFTRHRLVQNSQHITREQSRVVKLLQDGLGAIRDILLDGGQKIYCDVYRKAVVQLQQSLGENTFINQAPRYAMEALGMILIALFVVILSRNPGGMASALPVLAMLALGAQRLLPLMQQLYGNWSVVIGSRAVLADVFALLDQPLPPGTDQPEPEALVFHDTISIRNLGFRYQVEAPWVLKDINMEIRKGERIGIVGLTGSGKSTLLDLFMGLLDPVEGDILVDGQSVINQYRRSWQRCIAHVPQSIFLADTTIEENIAFGVPYHQIDHQRVREAAEHACIADFIESRPEGYKAVVGERGTQLSGGQRQRIGIARALYKRANVLIFDEATSALDNQTEDSVMSAIDGLHQDLTILIIAHRLTTLRNCDRIVELGDAVIRRTGSYEELFQ
jgi:ATP-binding cassette subfamily B protein